MTTTDPIRAKDHPPDDTPLTFSRAILVEVLASRRGVRKIVADAIRRGRPPLAKRARREL